MGAWGNGIWQNDNALEIRGEIQDILNNNSSMNGKEDEVLSLLIETTMNNYLEELLALFDMYASFGGQLDKYENLKKHFKNIMSLAYEHSELFKDTEGRKKALKELENKF